ncbi:hypothetical protein HEP84_56680 [Streptomyces sp. RLB1-33]
MQRRAPTADVTAQELREGGWWRGLTVYVVDDDYDLVSPSSGNLLGGPTELPPFARAQVRKAPPHHGRVQADDVKTHSPGCHCRSQ